MLFMERRQLKRLLEGFLSEDLGSGDVTSSFTPNRKVNARIISNSNGYVSGISELKLLFTGHRIKVKALSKDGGRVRKGQTVLSLTGMSRDILAVERTALNMLSHMSGVTTATRVYAGALAKSKSHAKVAATRKTMPGLRYFDKKAVVLGGGLSHRMGLHDWILIKDNHLKAFGNDVVAAVEAAKKSGVRAKIEVEVQRAYDALAAATYGANIIMFDNMPPKQVADSVRLLKAAGLRRRVILEVSGGVTLKTIGSYGKTGVDWISVGRITHSAPALDFSLDFD